MWPPLPRRVYLETVGVPSRPISGSLYQREMAERIEAAINKLGHRPNVDRPARLILGSSETLWLRRHLRHRTSRALLRRDRQRSLGRGRAVQQQHRDLQHAQPDLARAALSAPSSPTHFDGLIFAHQPSPLTAACAATPSTRPARSCWSTRTCRARMSPKFLVDSFDGGYRATRHLIERGHERIAHVTGPIAPSASTIAWAGFRQAMADAGLPSTSD